MFVRLCTASLALLDLARSRFSEKAFAVMDKDGSGEVDFIEFVLAVWNYCSFSHASLVRFAFDLYDIDGSGEIEHDEVVRCVREVWGSEWEASSTAQKIVAKLDAIMHGSASGRLSVQQFQDFALRHPMLLFPAFQLQTELQKKVLGEKFWLRAAKKRGSVNPRDLNWKHVQAIGAVSRQASAKFLHAIEDDLGEQLSEQLEVKKPRALRDQVNRPKSLVGSVRNFLGSNSRRSSGDATAASHTPVVAVYAASPIETAATQSQSLPASPVAARNPPSPKRSRSKASLSQPHTSMAAVASPTAAHAKSPPSPTHRTSALVVEDLDEASAGRRPSVKAERLGRLQTRAKTTRHMRT